MNPHKIPFVGKLRKSVKTLHKLDERGLIYEMDYYADYRIFMKLISKLATNAGCSTFTARNPEGDPMMFRNYDFAHYRHGDDSDKKAVTGLNVMLKIKSRHAKYKSFGMVDCYWLDGKSGNYVEGAFDDGKTDISLLLMLPFICMDGMNEKGLSLAISFLPCKLRWDPVDYVDPDTLDNRAKERAVLLQEPGQEPDPNNLMVDHGDLCINTADKKAWFAYRQFSTHQKEPNKKTMFHPVLMRLMLDNCATVEEAIEMAKSVNIKSPMSSSDFHIMVADANGTSVVLEWVDNKLVVVPADHCTNFYISNPEEKGGDRYVIMEENIASHPQGITVEQGREILEEISQDLRYDKRFSMSQWSVIYNMKEKTAKLWSFLDFSKSYEYKL